MDRTNVNKITNTKVLAKALSFLAGCGSCPFNGVCNEECSVMWYKALTGVKNKEKLCSFLDEIKARPSFVDDIEEEF